MAYEPLHHKYRPQRFADVVGQSAVVQTLSNAIRRDRIAPAYLFCGPRGTGKTSSARILAKSLNCVDGPTPEPCNRCEACVSITNGSALDTIEIDAASNTGVDNIRELIERSQFAPVSSRYKVYVLDEVHMLSTAAFNALLKTLEEPPPQVVFVLATTDPQRVLPTVISRCQRFDFRRIPLKAMVGHLREIAEQEKIAIAEPALELIAQIARGGLRDAESLLDQLSLLPDEISVDHVWDLVGAVPERELLALLDAIAQKDPQQVVAQLRHLMDNGKEPPILLQNLTGFYRDLLLAKTAPAQKEMVALTQPTWEALLARADRYAIADILAVQQQLIAVEPLLKNTTQPRLWLEISLLNLLQPPASEAPAPVARSSQPLVSADRPAPPPTAAAPQPPTPVEPVSTPPAPTLEPVSSPPVPATPVKEPAPIAASGSLATYWEAILNGLPNSKRALFVQHVCIQAEESDRATLALSPKMRAFAPSIQTQLERLESVAAEYLGHPIKLELVLGEMTAAATPVPAPTVSSPSNGQTPTMPRLESPGPPPTAAEIAPSEPAPRQTGSTGGRSLTPASEPSDLDRAVERLADFFSGSVVDLGEEELPDSPATVNSVNGAGATAAVEEEEELPF
ncbi:DNA polymerase III subunit gamma/tau [Synechococcus sp. PCC 7336]|uniref:DNA polymerase III subunit gamma/tau n=1 Tax=Synechococcus sp. PCC 7336 TaxID=195250 RepID=UPI000347A22B|nr:DNA polymerase III subunit gamma/tau [Synechococcus sp. PCC 7336]